MEFSEKRSCSPSDLTIERTRHALPMCAVAKDSKISRVKDRGLIREGVRDLPPEETGREFDLRSVRYSGTTDVGRDEERATTGTSHPRNSVCSRRSRRAFVRCRSLASRRVASRFVISIRGIDTGGSGNGDGGATATPKRVHVERERGDLLTRSPCYEVTKEKPGRFNLTPERAERVPTYLPRQLKIAHAENSSLSGRHAEKYGRREAVQTADAIFCLSGPIYRALLYTALSTDSERRRTN